MCTRHPQEQAGSVAAYQSELALLQARSASQLAAAKDEAAAAVAAAVNSKEERLQALQRDLAERDAKVRGGTARCLRLHEQ